MKSVDCKKFHIEMRSQLYCQLKQKENSASVEWHIQTVVMKISQCHNKGICYAHTQYRAHLLTVLELWMGNKAELLRLAIRKCSFFSFVALFFISAVNILCWFVQRQERKKYRKYSGEILIQWWTLGLLRMCIKKYSRK